MLIVAPEKSVCYIQNTAKNYGEQMMKKVIFLSAALGMSWLLIVQSGVAFSLLLFLLSGTIPGTSFTVPANIMLLAIIAISCLVVFHVTSLSALATKQTSKRRTPHHTRMPKRRFSHI